MAGAFLSASSLRPTEIRHRLSCEASTMGLQQGDFPGAIETDLGDGDALELDHPVFNQDGNFAGVAYRQIGGCEVLVCLG